MFKVIEENGKLNVINRENNKLVLRRWFDDEYDVNLVGSNPEEGIGAIHVYSAEKFAFYSLTGKLIVGGLIDNEKYDENTKLSGTEKILSDYYHVLYDDIFPVDYNCFDEHFAVFGNSKWISFTFREKDKKFHVPADEKVNNYYCFDYSGNLIMKANVKSIEKGNEIFEKNYGYSYSNVLNH